MPATVTLTATRGPLQGQVFVFDERSTCILGRDDDCRPVVSDAKRMVSRHHCLLDINPPDVRIRDFGSLNGTHVNEQLLDGQRPRGTPPSPNPQTREYDLKDGDELRVVDTVFRVSISTPACCDRCGGEIPDAEKTQAEQRPGVYRCAACRRKIEPPPGRVCAKCGRDVAGEVGAGRPGEYVCAACKADPLAIVKRLLELAQSGDKDLVAIQGYRILRQLGKGGMGAVYLARHERTGAEVALKVMLPRVAVQERAREMFLREAALTRWLRHPNVVELRDFGCADGTFFFTLEYCDGGSVADLMKQRGGRLPVAEALPIGLAALDGLEHAHTLQIPWAQRPDGSHGPCNGLVHRDLKPHNLFLSGGVAKVGDFGLAKAFDLAGLSGQTCTGAVAGTPLFMPRQQVVNFKYAKPEVDVWALAASLYFLLTGRAPRDFPQNQDPWQVVLETAAVPIRERDPSIPKKLADVIDAALVDKPQIGFKTAAELKRALQ